MAGSPTFGQTFYSRTITNDQPLAYWNFDEPNPTDNAIQQIPPLDPANDLVAAFEATRVAHGAIGSGLLLGNTTDLDGTHDNFSAPALNLGPTNLTTPWALEFWMQIKTDTASGRQDYLISTHFGGAQGIAFDWSPNRMYLESGSGSGENGITIDDQDTNWHHLVWVYYGSLRVAGQLDIYLDGVLHANQPMPGNPIFSLSSFAVGDYNPAGGFGFLGRLDEVAIYDLNRYTTEAQLGAGVAALVNDHRLASTLDASGVTVNITSQPVDAVGSIGGTTNFTVAATTSSGSLAYQWQKNWADIPGATNDSFTTPVLQGSDAGTNIFRARVSSGNVFVNTREAALVVPVTISIPQQPTNVTANVGNTATFSVVATSTPPAQLSFQWKKNGANIAEATNASYTTPVLQEPDVGTNLFLVRVSAGGIFVDSTAASLVVPVTITISQQPTNVNAVLGATAAFSVVATSSPPVQLSYQWKKNDANIPDATNSSYATPVLQLGDAGTNLFRVRVNVGGTFVESDEAALVVAAPLPPNTSYSQVVSNDAPILYWNFDEAGRGNAIQQMPVPQGETTVNDLVPAFGASRVDHAAIGSGLQLGYAADFHSPGFPAVNGDNFNAALPQVGSLITLPIYAIEFWIQLQLKPGAPDSSLQDYLIGFDSGGGLAAIYDWESDDFFEMYGGSEAQRTFTNAVSISQSDTSWHHVVWVYYGTLRAENRLDVYLDGIRKANIVTGYERELLVFGPITVGAFAPAGGAGIYGRMDEVAIYDFSTFTDESALTNHVNDLVARHFAAALPASLPTLSFSRAGTQLTLSWTEPGLVLQETAILPPPSWTDVPGGTNSPVTVTIGTGSKFFTLRKP